MAAVSFGKRIGDGTTEAVERLNKVGAANAIAATLADVDRAIAKLDEGTYGICDSCGEPIPAERLEAIPSAVLLRRLRLEALTAALLVSSSGGEREVRACRTNRRTSAGVRRSAPWASSHAKISDRIPNAVTLITSPRPASASMDRSAVSSSS